MNYIIFGGSGFIGTHLIHLLKETHPTDKIYCLDIVMPGEEGVVPGVVEKNDGVVYERVDVRKKIEWDIETAPDDVVFNLAAVHRTPGHEVTTKKELQSIMHEYKIGDMPLFIDVHVRQGIRSDMPKLGIDHKAVKRELMENLKK